jgi:hypothetical protein
VSEWRALYPDFRPGQGSRPPLTPPSARPVVPRAKRRGCSATRRRGRRHGYCPQTARQNEPILDPQFSLSLARFQRARPTETANSGNVRPPLSNLGDSAAIHPAWKPAVHCSTARDGCEERVEPGRTMPVGREFMRGRGLVASTSSAGLSLLSRGTMAENPWRARRRPLARGPGRVKYPAERLGRRTTPAGDAGSANLFYRWRLTGVAKPRGASLVPGLSTDLEPLGDSITGG